MKKTARKVLLMACSALLLVCLTVGATVAYLTSTTDVVTNTFTVGKLAIYLDETKVDDNGNIIEGAEAGRTQENDYKILPGHSYTKDPTVWFAFDGEEDVASEKAILFAKVENELAAIEDTEYTNVDAQIQANGWAVLSTNDETNTTVYYKTVVAAESKTEYKLFNTFKISGEVSNEEEATLKIDDYNNKTIKVTAYAIQADTLVAGDAATKAEAEAAWAQFE